MPGRRGRKPDGAGVQERRAERSHRGQESSSLALFSSQFHANIDCFGNIPGSLSNKTDIAPIR